MINPYPFVDGHEARLRDNEKDSFTPNPYKKGSKKAKEWRDGYYWSDTEEFREWMKELNDFKKWDSTLMDGLEEMEFDFVEQDRLKYDKIKYREEYE